MPSPRDFNRELREQRRVRPAIIRDTRATIIRLLNAALRDIQAALAGAPTDWQVYHLNSLKASIARALAEFESQANAAFQDGVTRAWQGGIHLVDLPLLAGEPAIAGPLRGIGELDVRQLTSMRVFLTDRIADIRTTTVNRINRVLGNQLIGLNTLSDTATEIQRILNASRTRAITIARTELGRVYAAAAQQRQEQASGTLPGLKKQWRRSGKVHSRLHHDAIDGQIRDVDKPFDVAGSKLMYPRDPSAPAKETINCGCESLPYMEHWNVKHPGARPFSVEEIAANPLRRDLPTG